MTENLCMLLTYVECANPYVSEVLDFPLYKNFKSNATESLSNIILDDLKTENTFGMEEYIEVNEYGYEYIARQEIRFSDFLGLQDVTAPDGYPVLENVETIGEFASLFRMDYDKMKPEDMDIMIIIPIIDCILGEDIITGERLNDFQRGMKLAGAAVDLFTLGQAMALTGGLEAGAKVIARTIAVELLSNAASYTVGYGADAIGMPLPITWMLSVVTGCTVSATVGGYLFKNPDGTITKCSTEEAEEIIKNLDAGAEVELTGLKALPEERRNINSFADLMSPEDAERYLKFLENGSTAGLTKEELEGIKKVDELLALNKINYQDILEIRDSGNALKGGTRTLKYNEVKRFTAEQTNQWFIDNVKPDYKPPYKPGTVVKEIELTENTTFVRVYDNMPDGSGMYGSWIMKAEDVEGLTPLEIQDKFALPNTPKYICDVELEAGTHIRVGEVNPLEGWGSGGGTQYDLIGQRIGHFKNERLLEGY